MILLIVRLSCVVVDLIICAEASLVRTTSALGRRPSRDIVVLGITDMKLDAIGSDANRERMRSISGYLKVGLPVLIVHPTFIGAESSSGEHGCAEVFNALRRNNISRTVLDGAPLVECFMCESDEPTFGLQKEWQHICALRNVVQMLSSRLTSDRVFGAVIMHADAWISPVALISYLRKSGPMAGVFSPRPPVCKGTPMSNRRGWFWTTYNTKIDAITAAHPDIIVEPGDADVFYVRRDGWGRLLYFFDIFGGAEAARNATKASARVFNEILSSSTTSDKNGKKLRGNWDGVNSRRFLFVLFLFFFFSFQAHGGVIHFFRVLISCRNGEPAACRLVGENPKCAPVLSIR